jgi:putative spermidine/putrescine transport system ATP-binding protein
VASDDVILSTKSASVRLEEVTKTLGRIQVLAGISLDIKAGEFVTLLGPSGSGKTSTLMAVAGFMTPDTGRILVGNRDVTHLPPGRERDMGIVFQNYALFPHMSVSKNVAYPLRVRGTPRREIDARVHRALELVQLGELVDRRPAQLSGGQQQRVALARALIFRPSVLLMDEPMGALDVRLKQELQWEIRRLQRAIGATVIYVTHDQQEALVLSDRVALLNNGRVEQYGPPEQLYRTPNSLFAARFLGESNLIHGQYDRTSPAGLRVSRSGIVLRLDEAKMRIAPAGRNVAALLRPELLAVSATAPGGTHAPENGVTSIDGIVEEAVFVGQGMRYLVNTPAFEMPLIVQQIVRGGSGAQLNPGCRARVSWDPADIHLVQADE